MTGSNSHEAPFSVTGETRKRDKNGELADAQHRIRNTFQTLISYIGITYSGRPRIDPSEIEKLVRVIHSLASLQDLGLQDKAQGVPKGVRLDLVLGAVAKLYSSRCEIRGTPVPSIYGTYRHATTLLLILHELLDNAARHGVGTIDLGIDLLPEGRFQLRVRNCAKSESGPHLEVSSELGRRKGLEIIEMLTKANFGSGPLITRTPRHFEALVNLPAEINVMSDKC